MGKSEFEKALNQLLQNTFGKSWQNQPPSIKRRIVKQMETNDAFMRGIREANTCFAQGIKDSTKEVKDGD